MNRHFLLVKLFVGTVSLILAVCPLQSLGQDAGPQIHDKLRSGQSIKLPEWSKTELETVKPERTIPAKWIQDLVVDGIVKLPIDIQNARIDGPLNLESVIFKAKVSFRNCRFSKSVDFHSATFEGSLLLLGSSFLQSADFRAVHAKRDFRVTNSSFHDSASFQDVHVDEQLNAKGTQFGGAATFVRAEVSKSAFFGRSEEGNRAEFFAPAKFQGIRIHGAADFKGSRFWKDVVFQNVQVEGSAFFDEGAEFKGKADFTLAHIYENAIFLGTRFDDDVRFDWIRIDGSASFWEQDGKGPEFWGNASFSSAVIGTDAVFTGTYFAHRASFDNADFKGSSEFTSVQFKEGVDLSGAQFSRGLSFSDTKFWGSADFMLAVGRDVHFPNVEFRKTASFRDAHFQVVYFGDQLTETANISPGKALFQPANETKFFESVDLAGLTYDRIYGNLEDILKRMAPFERQPYVQLEQYLRKIGADDNADAVYLERKKEESRQISLRRHPAAWLGDLLYRYTANYGILNWRLMSWALLFLGFGCWFFSHPGTVEAKKEVCQVSNLISLGTNVTAPAANPPVATGVLAPSASSHPIATLCLTWRQALAFSLHEFLPLSVPVGEKWVATSQVIPIKIFLIRRSIPISSSGYSTFLRAAGWIVVPVAVAALTGLLRRAGS